MATTNTTKIANAISILSDVLSTEIAVENHFLEDEEDTVSSDDYEDLRDDATDFASTQAISLEAIKHNIEDEIGAADDDNDWPDWDVDDEDDVGNGTVVVDADEDNNNEEESEAPAEPTDEEKIASLTTTTGELTDQIGELEAEKEGLRQTLRSVLDDVNELIDSAGTYQLQIESR